MGVHFLVRNPEKIPCELNLIDENGKSDQLLECEAGGKTENRDITNFSQRCRMVVNAQCKAEKR